MQLLDNDLLSLVLKSLVLLEDSFGFVEYEAAHAHSVPYSLVVLLGQVSPHCDEV